MITIKLDISKTRIEMYTLPIQKLESKTLGHTPKVKGISTGHFCNDPVVREWVSIQLYVKVFQETKRNHSLSYLIELH